MHWQATYKNGETVTEQDGISSDRLNRRQLARFDIVNDGGVSVFAMLTGEDDFEGFFYRRRTAIDQGGSVRICHIVGWKRGDDMSAAFVFEDGPIETISRFDDKHPWFYSPKFLPHELVEA